MTKKTIEELKAELEQAEKEQEQLKNGVITESSEYEPHDVVIMTKDGLMADEKLTPSYDFSIAQKGIILSTLSEFEPVYKSAMAVVSKGTKARRYDWLSFVFVLDEVVDTILRIVYDKPDTAFPSLPNMDVFSFFMDENSSWISEKVSNMYTQMKNSLDDNADIVEFKKKKSPKVKK